jgi:penicillin-binding protein 1C
VKGFGRYRRLWRWLALSALLPPLALLVWAACEPLPAALREATPPLSVTVFDRNGRLLHELRAKDGRSAFSVNLAEVSPFLVRALIATEDRRFYLHPGVDPLAMARALVSSLAARRIVSGASTITQQLARTVIPRPRTLWGKLREMAVALRIEASLDKPHVLEAYLRRVEFGPGLVGIEAASRAYFDKPARALDLAEAATLVGLVRGIPYDPRRHPERARRRRDWVLACLRRSGGVSELTIRTALGEPLQTRRMSVEGGAMHLVLGVAAGNLVSALKGESVARIRTTLDADLEREVETIAARARPELEAVGASSLAVLVVENATGDVLAHVGSPDYFAQGALGGNDGTRALRQPGSTLKPFVYATAIERLGWDLATVLPDLALELSTPSGNYVPKNYDGREHGPVRLRVALASSLNLPAVYAARATGPAAVLATLRRVGFDSLDLDAAHYGAALALGDGEVRLSELVAAYATLARDGEYRALRFARSAELSSGAHVEFEVSSLRPALTPLVARQLTDALADDAARSPMFGVGSVLTFPFPAAAKTGTSKGFRDNWAVAFTREVTVAVWVGNFDGRPLVRSSGVAGAGPILHDVMLAAMRGRSPAPLVPRDGLVAREVCALSGGAPTAACTVRVRESFPVTKASREPCTFHELVLVDPENGLLAAPGCRFKEPRAFENYPEAYRAFARAAGRPLAPTLASPRCASLRPRAAEPLAIAWPKAGQRFVLDPERGAQEIVVIAEGNAPSGRLSLLVDGRERARAVDGRVAWRLEPGEHSLALSAPGKVSESVRISVQ